MSKHISKEEAEMLASSESDDKEDIALFQKKGVAGKGGLPLKTKQNASQAKKQSFEAAEEEEVVHEKKAPASKPQKNASQEKQPAKQVAQPAKPAPQALASKPAQQTQEKQTGLAAKPQQKAAAQPQQKPQAQAQQKSAPQAKPAPQQTQTKQAAPKTDKAQKQVEPSDLSQSSEAEDIEEVEEKPAKQVASKPAAQTKAPLQQKVQQVAKPVQPAQAKPIAASKPASQPVKAVHKKSSEDIDSSEEQLKNGKKVKPATLSQPVAKPLVTKQAKPEIKAKPSAKIQDEELEEENVVEEEEPQQEEEQEVEAEEQEQEAEEVEEENQVEEPEEEIVQQPKAQPKAKQGFSKDAKSDAEFEVFLAGLPFQITEEEIKAHFKKCPDFKSVKLIMRDDGQCKGIGFLKFSTEQGRQAALKLHESTLKGRKIYVEMPKNPAERTPGLKNNFGPAGGEESASVIVRNLPFTIDEAALQASFAGCGSIAGVRIIRDEQQNSRGFGFVDFSDIDSAKKALKKAGEKFGGRQIDVQYSIKRENRQQGGGSDGKFDRKPNFNRGAPGQRGGNAFGNEKKGFISETKAQAVDLD